MILSCYYRTPVDKDRNEITQRNPSQVITHYGNKQFTCPWDITIAHTGEIIIVDYGNSVVLILDDNLNLLTVIGQGNGDSRLVIYPVV